MNQKFHVPKSDFQEEKGIFLYRLSAKPVSPYYATEHHSTYPTMDSPYSSFSNTEFLLVEPIKFEVIGSVTKKVYVTENFAPLPVY